MVEGKLEFGSAATPSTLKIKTTTMSPMNMQDLTSKYL
jgi:hypothetical protein